MAKTIIIDTEVKGVDQALEDIGKIDNAVDGVNDKSISPKFDTAKTEKSLENLQKTGEKIEKVGQGIAGGFALATGVVGSFGSELGFSSQEIENAQAKASSFIGILVSIKPVIEGVKNGFSLLGDVLKKNPLILLATILGGIIVSMLDMGAVMDGIKKGFKAVGDVAGKVWDGIVSGIDYAIDLYTKYLDLLTFGLLDINEAYTDYKQNIEDIAQAERERLAIQEAEIKKSLELINKLKAKAQLLDAEIKLIESQKKVVTERYDKEIALAQASGLETYAIEQQKLMDLIEFTRKEIKLKQERYEVEKQLIKEVEDVFNKSLGTRLNQALRGESELTKETKKKQVERNEEIKTLTTDLDKFETDLEIGKRKKQKENYDEALKLKEENLQKQKDLDELYLSEDLKQKEKFQQDYLDSLKNTGEEEIVINTDVLDQVMAKNEEAGLKEVDNTVKTNEDIKQLYEYRKQAINDTLTTLLNLNELFAGKSNAQQERAFKVQKAINIANAVIDTYRGANLALASSPPPFNFISAGAVVTAGLLNIKKIASTQFGGGVPSDGGGGGGVGSAPSLPTVDTSSVAFQFPSVGGNNPQSNMQTFVSVTEINSVNNRVQVAEANATFG